MKNIKLKLEISFAEGGTKLSPKEIVSLCANSIKSTLADQKTEAEQYASVDVWDHESQFGHSIG